MAPISANDHQAEIIAQLIDEIALDNQEVRQSLIKLVHTNPKCLQLIKSTARVGSGKMGVLSLKRIDEMERMVRSFRLQLVQAKKVWTMHNARWRSAKASRNIFWISMRRLLLQRVKMTQAEKERAVARIRVRLKCKVPVAKVNLENLSTGVISD